MTKVSFLEINLQTWHFLLVDFVLRTIRQSDQSIPF